MRETGIVRRIDELGRVVIPKEIRKTLRIKEGDPLEIYTDKGELLFKKYSPVASISSFSEGIAESIAELTEKTCIITDTDEIIYVSNSKYKDYVGKNISQEIEKTLKERKNVVISKSLGGEIIPLFRGEEVLSENQIIVPIVCNGDLFGSIVVFDRESEKVDELSIKLTKLGALILSKQFE